MPAMLPLADSSVDALIVLELLEHVPDPGRVVAELARVLKPGGTVLISVPSAVPRHDHQRLLAVHGPGAGADSAGRCSHRARSPCSGGPSKPSATWPVTTSSLLLHVLKLPSEAFMQIFSSVGHAIDKRASWTTSTTALHTLAFDLMFVADRLSPTTVRPAESTGADPRPDLGPGQNRLRRLKMPLVCL